MAKESKLADYNHVDLLFPSKYLKAADLRGKTVTVVIESIDPRGELQMRGGKKEKKPIVHLRGKDKAWVLNITNARAIAAIHGPEVTGWIGKAVTIAGRLVQFGGKEVDAVRVVGAPDGAADDEPEHDANTGEVVDEAREPGSEG
jgi:hypothetical protein